MNEGDRVIIYLHGSVPVNRVDNTYHRYKKE